ncbi:MAG: hypothetical protein K8S21_03750 [Gemmatimonadetes bacterium]|nr:hypothetical protein [Gemmatimonadota bacterium]
MNRELIDRILVTALGMALPILAAAQNVAPVTAVPAAPRAAPPAAPPPAQAGIHPSADSVRPYLVFAPRRETWFVAASRGKRMLLDIGRVDVEVRKDSAVAKAYRDAVAAASPVPIGTTFTLRGPWGTEQVRTTGVDTWNGRIVMVLSGSAAMDSAAQQKSVVAASASRAGAAASAGEAGVVPPPTMTAAGAAPCVRTPLTGPMVARVRALRDSIEQALRAGGLPPYERLAKRVTASSSQVVGCFGSARVALAVSLRAGATEWVRERIVLVDTLGRAQLVTVEDMRFKVHDLLHALDADGDGVDDLAAIGRAHSAGGTTLLRYDEKKKKLVRLTTGFVWEDL